LSRLLAAAAAACLLAALAATPAPASRGLTRTNSTALAPGSKSTVTATCPVGTHSTAGGFFVSPLGVPGSGPRSWTQISTPSGRRAWRVTGGASLNNPPATLFSSVRCERRRDGRIAVRLQGSSQIDPGTAEDFNFQCPLGTRPAGAGWRVGDPFDATVDSDHLIVIQSRRTTSQHWRVTAEVRAGASQPSTFTATVACERRTRKRLIERSRIVAYVDNQRASAIARCPRRTHVVAGGFLLSPLPQPTPGPVPFGIMDYYAAPTPRKWRVDLYDLAAYSAPTGSALTTYAYCRRNRLRRRGARAGAAVAPERIGPGRVEISEPRPIVTLAG
jgi:hypothetical protein